MLQLHESTDSSSLPQTLADQFQQFRVCAESFLKREKNAACPTFILSRWPSAHTGVLPGYIISFARPELSPDIFKNTLAINNIISAMHATDTTRSSAAHFNSVQPSGISKETNKCIVGLLVLLRPLASTFSVILLLWAQLVFVDRGHHHYLHSTLPPHSLTSPREEDRHQQSSLLKIQFL